ncbi:enoyl-CoA hydratase/isomerase family protein [Sphingomonas sp. IC4-52]|uniref:enoyl-CoA hydratase/isomerase family protein n=1 Tax=Sphingomonas sp. IC4-52 TaxID=2887202 RepID=UPI001D1204ED|nr:enoyl-CoA hydratase/isomerase family protein [Sphingomonas sp. IC4-52]MCC2980281.1 enoyl-CoA hydratase/isomerase family protein [Sphingomonas sp. IC4-52]
MPDALEAEGYSALGDRPLLMLDARAGGLAEAVRGTRAILIALDADGLLPAIDPAAFDVLLTIAPDPPAPWVHVPARHWADHLARLEAVVRRCPVAAQTAMRTLRIAEALPFDLALEAESHAYSMLLAGAEFRRWRADRKRGSAPYDPHEPRLRVTRNVDQMTITLDHPASRNALAAPMRDQLFEALAAVLDDPSAPSLLLEGAGPCFSVGGDRDELGAAQDVAAAHVIRTERSCARLMHRLGTRATVRVHGACIGSGLEIAAAASRRIAAPGAWFQLPELSMGLIPGAGGTVSVAQAIGRHRTAWMVLSGKRLSAATALHWGLVTGLDTGLVA